MSGLADILIAVGLGAAGTLFGGFLASRAARWLSVSAREGYAGYWVIFMALLAGLFSLLCGLLIARYGGFASVLPALLVAAAAAFGGIAVVALLAWLSRDRRPGRGGKAQVFDVEIRTPPGAATIGQGSSEIYGYLSAQHAAMEPLRLDFAGLRQEDGRWLMPGRVPLHTRRPGIYLALGGQRLNSATLYFRLDAVAPSQGETGWSQWLSSSSSAGVEASSDAANFELRVRLRETVAGAA
jgi:hypothetical protein